MANIEAQHLTTIAEIEDQERRDRIKRAWDAYYGESPVPLKARRNETTNDNVRINMARSIVDGGVAKLFGKDFAVNSAGDAADGTQDVIDATLRGSGGPLLWLKMGLSGGIGGTMFYRLSPMDDGSVRIISLDPQNVECEWDPDDCDIVNKWTVTWNTMDNGVGVVRRQIVEPGGLGWVITDQELREINDKTQETAWVTTGTTDWPHVYPPLGHAQNLPSPHTVYGISDIEPDTLALIASIERSISNIARIVRLYAHPRTWGRMIGDALNMDANPGSVLRLESPDAMLANLEMQSDLSGALTLYRELMGALRETTRMPDVAAGKLDTTAPLSGVALQILYAPLVEKTEAKQQTYGAAIVEMFRRALDLLGLGDQNIVTLGWPEIVPGDPLAERQTAVIDQGLGVSSQTLLAKLGYDPETEQAQRSAEDAAKAEAQTRSFNAGQLGGGQMPPSDAAVAAYDQSGRSAPA
jgi:hypothetical protein